jgi:putative transposase
MSRRIQPIITDQIYHVFNRGIANQPIFYSIKDYQRFTDVLSYYRFLFPDIRFSFYNRLAFNERRDYLDKMKETKPAQVQIYAYCLMPNHYHFILKELEPNGTRKFIANLQNSYAKYLNRKRKRNGSLFQEMFKSVRIENDELFMHIARYIHLNPLTSFIVQDITELEKYPYSSFPVYLDKAHYDFIDASFLLGFYSNRNKLKSFTLDQADYQREIHNLKYLLLE